MSRQNRFTFCAKITLPKLCTRQIDPIMNKPGYLPQVMSDIDLELSGRDFNDFAQVLSYKAVEILVGS